MELDRFGFEINERTSDWLSYFTTYPHSVPASAREF